MALHIINRDVLVQARARMADGQRAARGRLATGLLSSLVIGGLAANLLATSGAQKTVGRRIRRRALATAVRSG